MTHETENEFSERSIPQTAKEFGDWYLAHHMKWPDPLDTKGYIVWQTLKLMDQPNFEKSPAIVALSKAALLAFAEAYAKHTGGK